MRRLEILIAKARSRSLNKQYSATVGIPQEDFVDFANDAQDRLFSEAVKTHPKYFTRTIEIQAVSGQEAYSVPVDHFIGRIENLEFSPTGQERDYYKLDSRRLSERYSHPVGYPSAYIRLGSEFLAQPPPASGNGTFRLTYTLGRPRVEIRRAQVLSVTDTAGVISALNLKIAGENAVLTLDPSDEFSDYHYLTIVDRDGNVKARGLEYDSINPATGVVTLTGTHTLESGEAIAVDDFVVIGADSCNLPQLPDEAERYLIEYMVYRALKRDGNSDSESIEQTSEKMLLDIIASFADIEGDVLHVPVTNTELMDGVDWI